jgi:hypothetical protein
MKDNSPLCSSELKWAYGKILEHISDEPIKGNDNLELRTKVVNLISSIGYEWEKTGKVRQVLESQRNGHKFDGDANAAPHELAQMIYFALQSNMYPLAKHKVNTLARSIAAFNMLALAYQDAAFYMSELAPVIRTKFMDNGNRESYRPGTLCQILEHLQYKKCGMNIAEAKRMLTGY